MNSDNEMANLYLRRSKGEIIGFYDNDNFVRENGSFKVDTKYVEMPKPEVYYGNKRDNHGNPILYSTISEANSAAQFGTYRYIAKEFKEVIK